MSASTKKKLRKEQSLAQLTEKQIAEQKEAKKLKTTTIIFAVVILAVLVGGLAVMIAGAYNNSGITERNTTALTVGEHKLTAAELNYFYMDGLNEFYSEWYNSYGDYTATYLLFMMGLDITKPLNEQVIDAESGETFADYFADAAVNSAISAYAAYDLAIAEGKGMTELDEATVELTMTNVSDYALTLGYKNTDAYLKAIYGNGSSSESFRNYLEILSVSNAYMSHVFEGFTYETADLEAYSNEHFDEFSSFSYLTFSLNPSTFMVCTAKEGEENHVHSDLENETALNAAKAAADSILAAKPTDTESFNAAIKAIDAYKDSDTAICAEVTDLMYSEITNEKLASWLTESGRKAGDVTLLTNETTSTDADGKETTKVSSYTVAVMVGRNDNNMELVNVRHILKSFTGGTKDQYGNVTYSDEDKKVSEDAIKLLEENWKGLGTEEAFADLAKANSTDTGSASNGGLYENVYPGQMVASFNDWCFDESREAGDTGIVETSYGYHLVYFVGRTGTTYRNYMIENVLRNADYNEWFEGVHAAAKYTVGDLSMLKLDMVLNQQG